MCNGLCVYPGHFWGTGSDESVVWRPKSALQSTHLGCLPSKIPSIPIWNRGLACRRDLKAVLKIVDTAKRYVILSLISALIVTELHTLFSCTYTRIRGWQRLAPGTHLPMEHFDHMSQTGFLFNHCSMWNGGFGWEMVSDFKCPSPLVHLSGRKDNKTDVLSN